MPARHWEIRTVLWRVLLLNWLVAFAKVGYGVATGALSMTADGVHSLLDGASNLVGLVATGVARRPPDGTHPYGHRKFEALAAMAIAGLLLLAAYEVAKAAVSRLLWPAAPIVTPLSFGIRLAGMGVNVLVTRYETRRGRALKSQILLADALHTRVDVYASAAVLASLAAARLGYPAVDAVAALVLVGLILRATWGIAGQNLDSLADAARISPERIAALVQDIPGIRGCHKVRTRGLEDDVHVDLHIQVDPGLPIEEAHELSHRVKERILDRVPTVVDVVVHTEPDLGPAAS
ncbi:MAG TPA: cation diffusion facilitator family transporter [Candidatus Methylomirabilis sp.]|nr:cation diffusion facilitator family transporter [Candidatus Methylomirabilis sp.]